MVSRNVIVGIVISVVIAVAGVAVGLLYLVPTPPTPETKLVIYSTVDPEDFKDWQTAFNAKYPEVEIEYLSDRPGNIYTKITTEKAAGQPTADIVMVSGPIQLRLVSEGFIEAYKSTQRDAYPSIFKDADGYWTGVALLPMVQVYNTQLIPAAELPKTLDNLVDPKWQGKVTIHDVTLGTTGTEWLGTLKQVMGEAKWSDFITKLASNVKPVRDRTFEGVVSPIAAGEKSIGLTVYSHDFLSYKNRGAPIETFRVEGLPVLTGMIPVSLIQNATHPVAAKLWIDYILSEEGQKVVGNTEVRIAARPGVTAKYTLATVLPGVRVDDLIIFPNEDVRKNSASYKDQFTKLFAG